jgi:hypothetical protein
MGNPTLILKPFGEYEQLSRQDGCSFSELKRRVILGRFNLFGNDVHIPYPLFDYPDGMLAFPRVIADHDVLAMRFDLWTIFDVFEARNLPRAVHTHHPGSPEIVDLVARYTVHARELDDEALADWLPRAAVQMGVILA